MKRAQLRTEYKGAMSSMCDKGCMLIGFVLSDLT